MVKCVGGILMNLPKDMVKSVGGILMNGAPITKTKIVVIIFF